MSAWHGSTCRGATRSRHADIDPKYLRKILLRTYEQAPKDFEALLTIPGVGRRPCARSRSRPSSSYGVRASREDPARFSFAHGGKDGTPFPVDRATYDKTIEVLRDALNRASVGRSEKVAAFRRLARFAGRTLDRCPRLARRLHDVEPRAPRALKPQRRFDS
jgi:hypothetical protein